MSAAADCSQAQLRSLICLSIQSCQASLLCQIGDFDGLCEFDPTFAAEVRKQSWVKRSADISRSQRTTGDTDLEESQSLHPALQIF
jgi:hypothetical protein